MSETEASSLFERLGGAHNIAAVVEDVIDEMIADPRLTANPRIAAAHQGVTTAGHKFHFTEMICSAAGGPQVYTGPPMDVAHRHLEISKDEWRAFMDDLEQTLRTFDVPSSDQQELFRIVEGSREAIVITPLEGSPLTTAAPSR